MALVLLRVVEFVLGGKRAIGYAQGLVVMCTTLRVGLSASGAMHLGKQAPGSKDQPGRPRPRGVTSRPRMMRPTFVTLRSCDPERINLHSSMDALLLLSVVLLLLHGCEGRRSALRFRILLYVWSSRASFTMLWSLLKLHGSVYLKY